VSVATTPSAVRIRMRPRTRRRFGASFRCSRGAGLGVRGYCAGDPIGASLGREQVARTDAHRYASVHGAVRANRFGRCDVGDTDPRARTASTGSKARVMQRARQRVRPDPSSPSRTRPGELPTVTRSKSVGRDDLEAFRDGDPAGVRALYQTYGRLVYAV